MTPPAIPQPPLPLLHQKANMEACVRCGLCLEVCPTYKLTQLEEESPRGRIALAKAVLEGHLEITPDYVEHELSCLLCEGCTAVCPAGVHMEGIGIAVRKQLSEGRDLPARTRAVARIVRLLGDRRRLLRASRRLALLQRLGLLRVASKTRLLRLMGLSRAAIPPVPNTFIEPDGRGWVPAQSTLRGRVILFAGCVMSTLLSPIDVATGEILAAAGYRVEVARDQTCCGALAAHLGDLDDAQGLARRNIEALAGGADPIVVNSAGCGAFLKEYRTHFGPDAASVAARVVDLTELLDSTPPDLSGPAPEGPVAFQDPCHSRLAQRIVDPPRRLLSRIPGIELVEILEPETCCGSAGVYNITNRSIARDLGERKARAIAASGARTVVTSNPGCLLQLRGALQAIDADIPVLHIAEVLRRACSTEVRTLNRVDSSKEIELFVESA